MNRTDPISGPSSYQPNSTNEESALTTPIQEKIKQLTTHEGGICARIKSIVKDKNSQLLAIGVCFIAFGVCFLVIPPTASLGPAAAVLIIVGSVYLIFSINNLRIQRRDALHIPHFEASELIKPPESTKFLKALQNQHYEDKFNHKYEKLQRFVVKTSVEHNFDQKSHLFLCKCTCDRALTGSLTQLDYLTNPIKFCESLYSCTWDQVTARKEQIARQHAHQELIPQKIKLLEMRYTNENMKYTSENHDPSTFPDAILREAEDITRGLSTEDSIRARKEFFRAIVKNEKMNALLSYHKKSLHLLATQSRDLSYIQRRLIATAFFSLFTKMKELNIEKLLKIYLENGPCSDLAIDSAVDVLSLIYTDYERKAWEKELERAREIQSKKEDEAISLLSKFKKLVNNHTDFIAEEVEICEEEAQRCIQQIVKIENIFSIGATDLNTTVTKDQLEEETLKPQGGGPLLCSVDIPKKIEVDRSSPACILSIGVESIRVLFDLCIGKDVDDELPTITHILLEKIFKDMREKSALKCLNLHGEAAVSADSLKNLTKPISINKTTSAATNDDVQLYEFVQENIKKVREIRQLREWSVPCRGC